MSTASNDTTIDLTSPYQVLQRLAELHHASKELTERKAALEEDQARMDAEWLELEPIAARYLGDDSAVQVKVYRGYEHEQYVLTAEGACVDVRLHVYPSQIASLTTEEIESIQKATEPCPCDCGDCEPLPIYRRINPDVPPVVVTDQEAS